MIHKFCWLFIKKYPPLPECRVPLNAHAGHFRFINYEVKKYDSRHKIYALNVPVILSFRDARKRLSHGVLVLRGKLISGDNSKARYRWNLMSIAKLIDVSVSVSLALNVGQRYEWGWQVVVPSQDRSTALSLLQK